MWVWVWVAGCGLLGDDNWVWVVWLAEVDLGQPGRQPRPRPDEGKGRRLLVHGTQVEGEGDIGSYGDIDPSSWYGVFEIHRDPQSWGGRGARHRRINRHRDPSYLAFFGVAQHIVRFADILELRLGGGLGLSWVLIGVPFHGQLAVGCGEGWV